MDGFNFTTNRKIRCCFECKDRKLHCHSTCERYLKEKEEYSKEVRNVLSEKSKERIARDTKREGIKRMKDKNVRKPFKN